MRADVKTQIKIYFLSTPRDFSRAIISFIMASTSNLSLSRQESCLNQIAAGRLAEKSCGGMLI
jgi:hypothetical protein